MNIIAIDIGNTNITIALFLKNEAKFVESVPGTYTENLTKCLTSAWEQIPILESSKEQKLNGVIVVSSVKAQWT